MTKYTEKLRLKEQGEEDLYFSRRDQELIRAMHDKELVKALAAKKKHEKKAARSVEQDYHEIIKTYEDKPDKLLRAYRDLLNQLLTLFHSHKDSKRKS